MPTERNPRQRARTAILGTALAAALLAPAAVAWAGPRITGTPAVVRAGQLVEISWTPPPGADELELLLVLDSEGREPLRLTRCLPATSGSWLWRVPDLPAVAARLVLRWGTDGRELEGEPGPAFGIAVSGSRLTPLTRRGGELWEGWNSAPAVPESGMASGARASWPSGVFGAAALPREPLDSMSRPIAAASTWRPAPAEAPPAAPCAAPRPRAIPLRE